MFARHVAAGLDETAVEETRNRLAQYFETESKTYKFFSLIFGDRAKTQKKSAHFYIPETRFYGL